MGQLVRYVLPLVFVLAVLTLCTLLLVPEHVCIRVTPPSGCTPRCATLHEALVVLGLTTASVATVVAALLIAVHVVDAKEFVARAAANAAANGGRYTKIVQLELSERRFYVRLVYLVPLYASLSMVELIAPHMAVSAIFEQLKNVCEGFVTYTYWSLLVFYGGGYARLKADWPSFLLDEQEIAEHCPNADFAQALQVASPHTPEAYFDDVDDSVEPYRRVMPLRVRLRFAKRGGFVVLGRYLCLLYFIGNMVLAFLTAILANVSFRDGVRSGGPPEDRAYVEGVAGLHNSYALFFIARLTMLTPALLLIVLYIAVLTRSVRYRRRGLPSKFITVKAVVMLGVWQHVSLTVCSKLHLLAKLNLGMEPACDTGMLEASQNLREFSGLPQVILNNVFMCVELLAIAAASCIIFKPPHLLYRGGHPAQCRRAVSEEHSGAGGVPTGSFDDVAPLRPDDELRVPSPFTVMAVTDVFSDLVRGWSGSFDLPPFAAAGA